MSARPLSNSESVALALAEEIPEQRLAQAISEALTAETVNRDGTRSPDYRTRLGAAQLALHYLVGRPVERQAILTHAINDTDASGDIAERVARSPALREAIEKILAGGNAAGLKDG